MKIGLVILIFFLFFAYGNTEELNQIRSYFGQLQSEFFVAIGQSSLLSSMIAHELKNWKGIYLLSDSSIMRYAYENDNHNQFMHVKFVGSKSNAPLLTLSEICQSYFFKTPKLLVLTESQDHVSILNSMNWVDPHCLSEIIVVESQSKETDVKNLLNNKGYVEIARKDKLATYGLQKVFGVINYRKIQFQVVNRLQSTPIFIRQKHLEPIYEKILPSKLMAGDDISRPSSIYIHQTRYRVISLPDLIQQSQYLVRQTRPILVLNFHAREDFVYIGTSNFTVIDIEVQKFLLKKIRITLAGGFQQIFILMNDGSNWLQMIAEDGNTFYEKDSQYNNILAYKNRCIEYQNSVKVVIRNEIQLHGIDQTLYGNLERPFKEMVNIYKIEQQVIIVEDEIQLNVLIFKIISGFIIVTAAVLFFKKIYRSCKKEKIYQNISKDPTSSSLYNADNTTEETLP